MPVTDLLKSCDESIPEGISAIIENISTLKRAHKNIRGVDLTPVGSVILDLQRFRQLIDRCATGDWRYRDSELQAMKNVAQWTVDVNNSLRNQPAKTIDWGHSIVYD